MNVLFLSQIVPYPPHGGVLQRGYNMLRELGRRARVHLLAFVHPDELTSEAAIAESRRALGEFCETIEYFPLWLKASRLHTLAAIGMSACSSAPFSVVAHRSSRFREAVAAHLRDGAVDLVHVDTVALSQFVDGGDRPAAVLTHHNIESMLMERRANVEHRLGARQFLQRETAKLRRYEAAEAPRFELNIVVSHPDGKALATRVPSVRTVLVPNGVDVDYFSPKPELETPALVYTGGMNMFANRDAVQYFLAEIWPIVKQTRPDATFYAVGQDPPRELVAAAEHDPKVIVTGKVPDIRPYVWRSAVYVVPIRVGGGTRLKVLDAMATGKALVSTSIGCEGIDVVDGRHLLMADAPEAFAHAAIDLLGNAERRRALGSAARTLVEQRYAWPVIGDMLIEGYRDAIARRKDAR